MVIGISGNAGFLNRTGKSEEMSVSREKDPCSINCKIAMVVMNLEMLAIRK
jgi:hypothetical protein